MRQSLVESDALPITVELTHAGSQHDHPQHQRNTAEPARTLAPGIGLETSVRFAEHQYKYVAATGAAGWDWLVNALSQLEADRILLVSELSLPADVFERVARHIEPVTPTTALSFPGREAGKTLATLDSLVSAALDGGASRRSCVVAVGGGVAGNVGGMLAGLLFRGIRFVQIPTTLLAMSDSVLSLKQAVSSRLGKNDIGTFHTPEFVWANLGFLESLPVIDRQAAMCELIKNVVAIRPEDYDSVATLLDRDGDYSPEQYVRCIELAIDHKSSVMANDPFEKGGAMVLEYGHTVGHAIEITAGGVLPHGIAIGIGMIVAARVARLLRIGDVDVEIAIRELLARIGAPTGVPAALDVDELMVRVRRDNKRGYLEPVHGMRDMVLLEALGRPRRRGSRPLTRVPEQIVRQAILECRAQPGRRTAPARAIGAVETSVGTGSR